MKRDVSLADVLRLPIREEVIALALRLCRLRTRLPLILEPHVPGDADLQRRADQSRALHEGEAGTLASALEELDGIACGLLEAVADERPELREAADLFRHGPLGRKRWEQLVSFLSSRAADGAQGTVETVWQNVCRNHPKRPVGWRRDEAEKILRKEHDIRVAKDRE